MYYVRESSQQLYKMNYYPHLTDEKTETSRVKQLAQGDTT